MTYRKIWGAPKRMTLDGRRNFVVSNGVYIKDVYDRWSVLDWLRWALIWRCAGDPFFEKGQKKAVR